MTGRNGRAEGQCTAVGDRRAKLALVDAAIAVCGAPRRRWHRAAVLKKAAERPRFDSLTCLAVSGSPNRFF
jgi:hypothetical protein